MFDMFVPNCRCLVVPTRPPGYTLHELSDLAATLDPSDFIEIDGDGLVAHWLTEDDRPGGARLREIARIDLR